MAQGKRETVQLGCGTLVLIAIIVLVFSGANQTKDIEREISHLQAEIAGLRKQVSVLISKVDSLTVTASLPLAEEAPEAKATPE